VPIDRGRVLLGHPFPTWSAGFGIGILLVSRGIAEAPRQLSDARLFDKIKPVATGSRGGLIPKERILSQ
jgi:hypothetical protein